MRTKHMKQQRGQAMTEFVAALALFVPLFMGIVYLGKYSDIKHQAIQASRYAALQRALDPHKVQTDDSIRREMTARFFRDNGRYQIARNDSATGPAAGDLNPNWYQLNGDSMLTRYDSITLQFRAPNPAVGGIGLSTVKTASNAINKLDTSIGVAADVRVPVADILHFEPLRSIGLNIGATTVMAGDAWNAAGAKDVADHFGIQAVPARAGNFLNSVLNLIKPLFNILGAPPPNIGCVKPDVVPNLSGSEVAPGATYDPGNDSPTNPSDQCL